MPSDTPQSNSDTKLRFDFIARVHVFVHENVRFADTKASAILAACGFIFTGMLTRADGLGAIIGEATGAALACILVLFLAVVGGLVFTSCHCILCVIPRLGSSGPGMVYWEQIRDADHYVVAVKELPPEEVISELARHVESVAHIPGAKFAHVRRALLGLSFTLGCTLLLSIFLIFVSAAGIHGSGAKRGSPVPDANAVRVRQLEDRLREVTQAVAKVNHQTQDLSLRLKRVPQRIRD